MCGLTRLGKFISTCSGICASASNIFGTLLKRKFEESIFLGGGDPDFWHRDAFHVQSRIDYSNNQGFSKINQSCRMVAMRLKLEKKEISGQMVNFFVN
jgi:hypothetical protein